MNIQPHSFWQEILPAAGYRERERFEDAYPAFWGNGKCLLLPIRPLSDGQHALASLILNQASFTVQDALSEALAARLRDAEIDVIVGLPTLGLTLAAAVARALGHCRYVPLGTSRKFWYRDELSVPLSSITTPEQIKRLYMDPRMLPLLEGKRVGLVDDVISSGTSILSGLALLHLVGIEPVAIGVAMLQSDRWRARLSDEGGYPLEQVFGVLETPLLERAGDGLWMRPRSVISSC